MEPLKEMFNKAFYTQLVTEIGKVYPAFDGKNFLKEIQRSVSSLELNQRLRLTSETLRKFLPADFREAVEIQKKIIPHLKRSYTNLVFPDFVALYGKQDIKYSLDALKFFTSFGSSEFAVREFLKSHFEHTIKEMQKWAKDSDHHVRRLASEGSRPRLPWSFKLDVIINDPGLTLPILEALKNDPELYVRKSVANHLNDISKDHPEFLLSVITAWKGNSGHTDWILKHASRTLLKSGNKEVLAAFGIRENKKVELKTFEISSDRIKLGEKLQFSFLLGNSSKKPVKTRLEYAIYFRVSSGKFSRKVFQISNLELKSLSQHSSSRSHKFIPITTRKYYAGVHQIGLIVNGKEVKTLPFKLIC